MKKQTLILAAIFVLATAGSAFSGQMEHDMAMGGDMTMGDTAHPEGTTIHESMVEGYHFTYHLLDIREKMAEMRAAGHSHGGMDATHHLMVYIRTPGGESVGGARVGYLVVGPDGEKQQLMCMEMGGGYGSDVTFRQGEVFTIKTKVVVGETKLMDSFSYQNSLD